MKANMIKLATLLTLIAISASAPARHGSERIVVQNAEKDKNGGMQFKQYSGNETESMFKTVKGDDLNITMQEANVTTTGYVSEEVKEQQVFHHYNNTNFFVTFRDKYLSTSSVKQLAQTVVKEVLLSSNTATKVRVKKIYKTFAIFELGDLKELRPAAEFLSQRDEILACEWLQKKRLFGINADLNEMAKFKSKIKKNEEVTDKGKEPPPSAEPKKSDL